MHEKSDARLLREYAEHGEESAFVEIKARYGGLVYSAALRQVDSPDVAAEVAQQAFIGLARAAQSLSLNLAENDSLTSWLWSTARNISLNLRRDEKRRHSRERQAMDPQLLTNSESSPNWESIREEADDGHDDHDFTNSESSPNWESIRPLLDEAVDSLDDEEDRKAILLRYFQNLPYRAVGLRLGVSDDTAQQRCRRALKRLLKFLMKQGIKCTEDALAAIISANAVHAPPASVVAALSSEVLARVAAQRTTLAHLNEPTTTPAPGLTRAHKVVMGLAALGLLTGVLLLPKVRLGSSSDHNIPRPTLVDPAPLKATVEPKSPGAIVESATGGMTPAEGTNAPAVTNALMALIPAGSFVMGDGDASSQAPAHEVQVSAFYMDKYEVTLAFWDEVALWAMEHGYSFDDVGIGKAASHPVALTWLDAVKFCNARSEKEGREPAYYTSSEQTTVYRRSLLFSLHASTGLLEVVGRLKAPTRPFDAWFAEQLRPETRALLASYQAATSDPAPLGAALLQDLNNIAHGPLIYDQERFEGITLSPHAWSFVLEKPRGANLLRLNRMLLVDAYPAALGWEWRQLSGSPVLRNDWVKWNSGYRLPTEAEWEKAARGGLSGKRFPWGDTINHSQANYYSSLRNHGYHPSFNDGVEPYTSPVGSFAPSGYGLFDMVGNLSEWCWDDYATYPGGSQIDPRGPDRHGCRHIVRGGGWSQMVPSVSDRAYGYDIYQDDYKVGAAGFRCVLPTH